MFPGLTGAVHLERRILARASVLANQSQRIEALSVSIEADPKTILPPGLPPECPLTCPDALPLTTVSLSCDTFPQLTEP